MLSPKVEVSETEDAYRVTAELPGFKKGVLHVTVPKTAGGKPGRRQIPVKRAE